MSTKRRVLPIVLGDLETNAYILAQGQEAFIIDPGQNPGPLLDTLAREDFHVSAVFLTHTHADHIAGLKILQMSHPCPVYVHPSERAWVSQPGLNLSESLGSPFAWEGDLLPLEEGPWPLVDQGWIVHTPGHSPGGVCLFLPEEGWAFTGDLLFAGSVGRTDFPGGDSALMTASLKKVLARFDANFILYPGHGPPTTMETEIATNPYLSFFRKGNPS